MTFDLNSIPPQSRSRAAIAAHLELYNRTLDTVRVHNPTDEDFIVYNDRLVSNERYTIPNKNRDIGYGKGNNDVPRYIAMRFVDKMGMEMISKTIKEDWDKKKGKFRLEEQGTMEERLALRSSDPKLWDDVTKKLWLGVINRYQDETYELPDEKAPRKDYASSAEEALDRLGMVDAELGIGQSEERSTRDVKDQFINDIT